MDILGHDVAAVQQAGGHVLAVARIALDHLVVGLEAGHGDFLDGVCFVGGLGGADDGGVGDEREVDARVGDEVGLKLVQVDVEGAVEAERGGDGGHDFVFISANGDVKRRTEHTLSNQTVQVLVVRTLNAKIAAANVVDGLVVDHEAAVGVLQSSVRGQDGVVRLDNRRGDLGRGIHAELELALLAIIHRQTFHQQSSEAGSSTPTEGMENQESLQTRAVIRNASNLVQDLIDQLLPNSVMAASIVVGRVFFAGDHLFRMEKAAVGAGADFVDDIGLEVAVDGAGDVFALACVEVSMGSIHA